MVVSMTLWGVPLHCDYYLASIHSCSVNDYYFCCVPRERVLFCLWPCLGLWYWRRASLQPQQTADNTSELLLSSLF